MGIWARFKAFFKRQASTASIQTRDGNPRVVGHPVHVNLSATSRERQDRNLARMKTCREVMARMEANGEADTPAYRLFENEYRRRQLAMQQVELSQGR